MIKIGELLRKLRSLRSCFNILPPEALTPQGIEGAMKRDVSKHWCTLQWCASRGWFIAHENWTSCQALCIISYPLVNSNLSYSPETPNWGQIRRCLEPCDLVIWHMTLQNNRAPLLCYFKLCAACCSHWWIQTGVTVRKRLSWVVTSVTLTFDLWPWPFAWTLPWSVVITPENVMMIRWREHSQKGVMDRQWMDKFRINI